MVMVRATCCLTCLTCRKMDTAMRSGVQLGDSLTHRTLLAIYASLLFFSCLDFVLPVDLDEPVRESEADDHAQLSLTLIQFTCKSSSSTSSFPTPQPHPQLLQSLWRWASHEAAGVEYTGGLLTQTRPGGSGHMVVFHLDRGKSEIRLPPERLSSPF